jgi:tRNA nucleotidyltransferase (CCA-adding enzyme)
MREGPELLERLRALPGGRELLAAADAHGEVERLATVEKWGDIELIGGAVRDLLLERTPRELDVVLDAGEADFGTAATAFAHELAARIGSGALVSSHERFGTALVEWDGGRLDVAARRVESYAAPGALPTVGAGTPEQDLARRDFTVNAIALALSGSRAGELRHAQHALEDLAAGRLRVLHEQSFRADPTRLLRLARYAGRLGFTVEPGTAALAGEALAGEALAGEALAGGALAGEALAGEALAGGARTGGALATVSGARVGAELRLALGEADAVAALGELERQGVLGAIHPRLRFEEHVLRDALALLPTDGRAELLLLAGIALPLTLRAAGDRAIELRDLLDRLQFSSADRDRVIAAALAAPELLDALAGEPSAWALYETAHALPVEAVALAGALDGERPGFAGGDGSRAGGGSGAGGGAGGARAGARRWLDEVRHVRLQIGGEDLLAAGVRGGPELGARLQRALMLRLEGKLEPGPEAELAAALAPAAATTRAADAR